MLLIFSITSCVKKKYSGFSSVHILLTFLRIFVCFLFVFRFDYFLLNFSAAKSKYFWRKNVTVDNSFGVFDFFMEFSHSSEGRNITSIFMISFLIFYFSFHISYTSYSYYNFISFSFFFVIFVCIPPPTLFISTYLCYMNSVRLSTKNKM